ncbi:hypothetical protein AB1N83_012436 [Pleurotus pulmonarius]
MAEAKPPPPHPGDSGSDRPAPRPTRSAEPPAPTYTQILENPALANNPKYLHTFGVLLLARLKDTPQVPQDSNANTEITNGPELEDGIAALRRACDLTPDNRADKPTYLAALSSAIAISTRFDRLAGADDLQDAIVALQRADALAPDEEVDKPGWLNRLGTLLNTSYEQKGGNITDLEASISAFRRACDLTPDDASYINDKADRLFNLGSVCYSLFVSTKDLKDLDAALEPARLSNELTPMDHESKPLRLSVLSLFFNRRFQHRNDTRDRDTSIAMRRQAAACCSDNPTSDVKGYWLCDLGGMLFRRFQSDGDPSDLSDAITALEQGIALLPDTHTAKPTYLTLLLVAYEGRYSLLADPTDLDGAVSTGRQAVALGASAQSQHLLAGVLHTRFERAGAIEDLQEAISLSEQASELQWDNDVSRVAQLTCFSACLGLRFTHLGDPADLERAIAILRRVCDIDPTSPPVLSTLGVLRLANDLESGGPATKATCMNNLGSALWIRFKMRGDNADPKDLDEAADLLRQAEAYIPHGTGKKEKTMCLYNLGCIYQSRFAASGDLGDLGEAITLLERAGEFGTDDHAFEASRLGALAAALQTRYQSLDDVSDLSTAITLLDVAIQLSPDGRPNLVNLHNLAACLLARFERVGDEGDLAQAVGLLERVAGLTPEDHPEKRARMERAEDSARLLRSKRRTGNSGKHKEWQKDSDQSMAKGEKSIGKAEKSTGKAKKEKKGGDKCIVM